MMTVIRNINPAALHSPGISWASTQEAGLYPHGQIACGSTLDLVAHIAANGRDVRLMTIPKLVQCLGYDEPAREVAPFIPSLVSFCPGPPRETLQAITGTTVHGRPDWQFVASK